MCSSLLYASSSEWFGFGSYHYLLGRVNFKHLSHNLSLLYKLPFKSRPIEKVWGFIHEAQAQRHGSTGGPKDVQPQCGGGGGGYHKHRFLHVRMPTSACLWACWSLTSPLIPLKHNKSYLKPGWTCRGSHSQENHFQLNLCSASFLPPSPRGPPLAELHLGGGGPCPYSSNRQVQPAGAEHGALRARPLRLHPRLNHVDSYGTFLKSGHGSRPDKIHKTFSSGSMFEVMKLQCYRLARAAAPREVSSKP